MVFKGVENDDSNIGLETVLVYKDALAKAKND